MTTFQWLLALHVTGAFLLLGAVVVLSVLAVLAHIKQRPSEIALFLGLSIAAVPFLIAGEVLAFVFGLWLVHDRGLSYGTFWISASIVLLVAGGIAGKKGGDRADRTRELALELAAKDDAPSPELRARLRDPVTLALSWGAGLAAVVILAFMIWKPGA